MKIISKSENETLKLGKLLAKYLNAGDIVCLSGNLGSGKTILAKGIALGLGVDPNRVISPTFVLIHQHHQGRVAFNHFDLYRLKSLKEIADLGFEEYFYGDAITVVEWAERLKNLLPKNCLRVRLAVLTKNKRCIDFSSLNKNYQGIIKKIKL